MEKEEGRVRIDSISLLRFHRRIAKLERIERIRFSSQSFSVPWIMHGTRMAMGEDRLCKTAVKMFSKCFRNCSVDERFVESLKLFLLAPPLPLTKTEPPHANSTFVSTSRELALRKFHATRILLVRGIYVHPTQLPRKGYKISRLFLPLCVLS